LKNFIKILGISLILFQCQKKETDWPNQMELLGTYDLSIPEPSGLAMDPAGNLFVVSDQTNQMYQINSVGQTVQTFGFTGNDLEGISYYKTGKFLLAEERTKNIVVYNPVDNTFESHLMSYENTDSNSGIEGVAYNPNTETIYFVNEKNPGKLFKTDAGFNISGIYDLNFDSDFSDVFFETNTNILWILSDESQTVHSCSNEGVLTESFSINVDQPEGIVVTSDKIYIVSDSQKKLYIFQKPN
jgi:uncharacterized protein YjiK